MKKSLKSLIFTAVAVFGLSLFAGCKEEGIVIKEKNGKFTLYIDGVETYIKGVGGAQRLDIAAASGANAIRTWGGNVERSRETLANAAKYNMYVMMGVGMTKDSASYTKEEYKERLRKEVTELATAFKDDKNLLVWGLGNELDLGNANNPTTWSFVNELAQIIKSIDKRHLVSTIIAHNAKALSYVGEYAPDLDVVGINSYGAIVSVEKMVNESKYNGAYFITEWGPTGHWEVGRTSWRTPIEQTSEEKRIVYEERYNKYILEPKACLGSFVFLWGQKQERTPTWYSMFVESNVEGLPLKGEKTPQVEAMQRVWSGKEPEQTAPVITSYTIDGKKAAESIILPVGGTFTATVEVHDKEGDKLSFVWEILGGATVLGSGGSYESRPARYGEVITGDVNSQSFTITEAGRYNVFVYVLDNTGFVATANIPVSVE